nr:MAG TPA: hypothetical protein [Bacteriophage sp.]
MLDLLHYLRSTRESNSACTLSQWRPTDRRIDQNRPYTHVQSLWE